MHMRPSVNQRRQSTPRSTAKMKTRTKESFWDKMIFKINIVDISNFLYPSSDLPFLSLRVSHQLSLVRGCTLPLITERKKANYLLSLTLGGKVTRTWTNLCQQDTTIRELHLELMIESILEVARASSVQWQRASHGVLSRRHDVVMVPGPEFFL